MAGYHLNRKTGETGKCEAEKRACPVGSAEDHFESTILARQAYEKQMSADTVSAVATKVTNPSTPESVAAMRNPTRLNPLESVAKAEEFLLDAGKLTSERLSTLWDRDSKKYIDKEQGEMVHELTQLQASALLSIMDAQDKIKGGWDGEPDAHPAIPELESAVETIRASGKLAGHQLTSLFDKEIRRYSDPEQTDFLHELINRQALAFNRARFTVRDLKNGVPSAPMAKPVEVFKCDRCRRKDPSVQPGHEVCDSCLQYNTCEQCGNLHNEQGYCENCS